MSRRGPNTTVRLTSAIGVVFAEVRTMTVISNDERDAQHDAEHVLQTLLKSPLLVQRIAEKMDDLR